MTATVPWMSMSMSPDGSFASAGVRPDNGVGVRSDAESSPPGRPTYRAPPDNGVRLRSDAESPVITAGCSARSDLRPVRPDGAGKTQFRRTLTA